MAALANVAAPGPRDARRRLLRRRPLTPRGTLVLFGGESNGRWLGGVGRIVRARLLSPVIGQTLRTFVASENAADLSELRRLVENRQVTAAVDRVFALADTAAAVRWMA